MRRVGMNNSVLSLWLKCFVRQTIVKSLFIRLWTCASCFLNDFFLSVLYECCVLLLCLCLPCRCVAICRVTKRPVDDTLELLKLSSPVYKDKERELQNQLKIIKTPQKQKVPDVFLQHENLQTYKYTEYFTYRIIFAFYRLFIFSEFLHLGCLKCIFMPRKMLDIYNSHDAILMYLFLI